ncbi:MAG: PAS domain S-box protein [bacterium]|nr:PAS domain S-box protein [bacterium]
MERSRYDNTNHFTDESYGMADWVWEIDRKGIYTFISENVCRILGYQSTELIGTSLFDWIEEEESGKIKKVFHRIRSQAYPIIDLETWRLTREGEPVCILTNGIPILNEEGTVTGFRGVDKDITRLKHTEKDLLNSRERYRRITEAITDYIYTVRVEDGCAVETIHSPASAVITGYTPDEFAMNPHLWILMVHKDDRDAVKEQARQILTGIAVPHLEHRIIRKDGTPRWVKNSFVPNYNANGTLLSYDGVIRDISERKNIQDRLQYRAEFERIISNISAKFINLQPDEINRGIDEALKLIGEFSKVDRCYIFQVYENGTKVDNTHEWCAEGAAPQVKNLKAINLDLSSWITQKLKRLEVIHIPSIEAIPQEREKVKQFFRNREVKSMITVPMVSRGLLIGFFGFDTVHSEKSWSEETITLLKIISEIFTNAIERMGYEKALIEYRENLKKLVEERTAELTALNKLLREEVNEHRMADIALRDSEDKFRTISASAPDAIIIINNSGEITYWNDSAEKIFGYTKEEITGTELSSLLPFHSYDTLIKKGYNKFARIRTHASKDRILELTAIKKDGSEIPVEISISSIKLEDRWNAIGIVRDITERKKSERQISRLATVIEQVNESVVITNLKGSIEYVNPFFERSTGYSASEVLGENSRILKSELNKPEVHKKLWNTISDGNIWQGTLRNKRKDGVLFDEEASIFPIKDSSGNIINYAAVKRDITERKIAEEELIKHSRAVEQSLNSVMITGNDGTIEYVNPKFSEITGYSYEEVMDKNISGFLQQVPVEPDGSYEDIWGILNTKGVWEGELYNNKKNGTYFWEFASISPVKNPEGEITHYLKVAVDITKRKASDRKLLSAMERAEVANRIKSEFLANMSHEIRTPMNSILGFIELLGNTSLDEKQDEYVSIITSSSKTLLGIINDILDFSKIESGKLEVDAITFSPEDEFEPLIELFAVKTNEKIIDLIEYISPELPEFIIGDPLRIKQVLSNLISNAIKFTPEYGRVFVEIKPVENSGDPCGIIFSVTDTGIGIEDDKQKTIFEAFSQADGSVSRKYGGTGLGLSISYNLVKLMNSELHLKSAINEGSTFSFQLDFPVSKKNRIITRRNYCKDINYYLYTPGNKWNQQLEVIERYLESFNCHIDRISSKTKFNELPPRSLIFILYSSFPDSLTKSEKRKEIQEIRKNNNNQDNPFSIILIANEREKDGVYILKNTVSDVIYQPVNGSKILNAIIGGQHGKIMTDETNREQHILADPRFTGKTLVVEDNDINQKLISIMLEELGIEVEIANNGEEAVDKFRNNTYDLILMDVHMPVMDGIEATRQLLSMEKQEKRIHTPIVALTADAISGDREKLINQGMDDYLSKPINTTRLIKILQLYLHQDTIEKNKDEIPYELHAAASDMGVKVNVLKKLLIKFLTGTERYTTAIQQRLEQNSYEAVFQEAHKLKGAALNLRLEQLAALSLELEKNAKIKNNIDSFLILDKIVEEINRLKIREFSTIIDQAEE